MHKRIDFFIRKAIELGKQRYAICPMGEYGILTKQILNWRYGIIEEFILDNELCKLNKNIFPVSVLSEKNCTDLAVILNVRDYKVNAFLYKELSKYISAKQIINIWDPFVENTSEKYSFFLKMRNLLKVMRVREIETGGYIRIGKDHDGGYIMLDRLSKEQIAYSFGISDDVSWDMDMANRGIDVYMYDHTINSLSEQHGKFHFQKIGISDKDSENVLSMETILAQNGHQNNNNLLLKMDVEGAEWAFLNSTSSDVLSQFAQMTFEFHSMTSMEMESIIISALEKLNKTHCPIWIHGNNAGIVNNAKNILFPSLLEVTYIRRTDYNFEKSSISFPMELDMPNIDVRNDIYLGVWG
jgi:hypothetical protein